MATAAKMPEGDQDTTSRHIPSAHSYGSLIIAFPTPSVVRGSILKKEVSPKANAPGETTQPLHFVSDSCERLATNDLTFWIPNCFIRNQKI